MYIIPDNRRQLASCATPLLCSTSETSVKSDQVVTGDQVTSVSAVSQSVSRQPSYLNAVNRADEMTYRDANPKMKSAPRYQSSHDVRSERAGMCSISENEEYQQPPSSAAGHPAILRGCCADSRMVDNRRTQADTSKVETRVVGRGRTGNQADLWEWCKATATDGGAADIATYIRRDDVRKVLQLRGQKMAAAAAEQKKMAQLNQSSSRLQPGSAVGHGFLGLRPGSVAVQKDSCGYNQGFRGELHPGSAGSHHGFCQPAADLRQMRSNTDAVDSVSVGSQKDSGYRSEEDRHSGKDSSGSPTLSASDSAVSLATSSNCAVGNEATAFPDMQSLCSSFESLCSVQSGCSLPVTMETRLRAIPETPQDSSSATRLRHQAEKLFSRSAKVMGVGGHRQPVKPDTAAVSAVMNSKYLVGSASSQHETDCTGRPASAKQLPVLQFSGPVARRSGVGYVRHAESEPAINRLSSCDVPLNLLEGHQHQRPAIGSACRYTANMMAPSTDQSLTNHREVDQSKSNAQRILGREYFRETGAPVPSLRQPPTSKLDCRHVVRHGDLSSKKLPWK